MTSEAKLHIMMGNGERNFPTNSTAAEIMEINKENPSPLNCLCNNNYKKEDTLHIQYTLYIHSI